MFYVTRLDYYIQDIMVNGSNIRNKNGNDNMIIPNSICKILSYIQLPANSNILSHLLTIVSHNGNNNNNNGLCY